VAGLRSRRSGASGSAQRRRLPGSTGWNMAPRPVRSSWSRSLPPSCSIRWTGWCG